MSIEVQTYPKYSTAPNLRTRTGSTVRNRIKFVYVAEKLNIAISTLDRLARWNRVKRKSNRVNFLVIVSPREKVCNSPDANYSFLYAIPLRCTILTWAIRHRVLKCRRLVVLLLFCLLSSSSVSNFRDCAVWS